MSVCYVEPEGIFTGNNTFPILLCSTQSRNIFKKRRIGSQQPMNE